MKKLTRFSFIAMLVMSLVLITACGDKGESTVFERKQDGLESIVTYYHDGDKVSRQTTENKVAYKLVNFADKKDAEAKLADVMKAYEDVEGLKHEIKFNDNDLEESLEVVYDKLDYEKAKKIPNFGLEGDPKQGVSLQKSEELLKKQGYTKVEK